MRPATIIIIVCILTGCENMEKTFEKERKELLVRSLPSEIKVFSEETVHHLPEQLKRYLLVCGYMNTPVPINANVYWTESFLKLSPKNDWGEIQTTQFNSVNPIARTSLMRFISMPFIGRDIYRDGYGEMKGKLFNLFRIVFTNSKETAQSALITVFSEFLFIPGYILLPNIEWESLSENTVRATLMDNGIVVSGVFHFDEDGLFSHFETDDRYYETGKNTYNKVKYSAVVDSYKNQGGIKIPERVRIIWHLTEGDYEYYKGIVNKIEFNVNE
jgi:hypothetical protein